MSEKLISDLLIDNIGGFAHVKAREIIDRTFNLIGVDNIAQSEHLNKIGIKIERLEFQPNLELLNNADSPDRKNTPEFELADQVLLHALYAIYTNDRILEQYKLMPDSGADFYCEYKARNIFLSLMQANYYLAKLESRKEVPFKPYDGRAEKGAHGKHKKPSKSDQEKLISTMTKNIILQGSLPDNTKGGKLVDEIAKRIHKTNQDYEIVHYENLDDLKHYINNALYDLETPTRRANKNLYRLKFMAFKQDPEIEHEISIDSAYTQGKIDATKALITQQLEHRFGKLSKSTIETIEHTRALDELLTYLSQVNKVKSPEDLNLKKTI